LNRAVPRRPLAGLDTKSRKRRGERSAGCKTAEAGLAGGQRRTGSVDSGKIASFKRSRFQRLSQ